ncbi:hypothetical protein EYF80_062701 [Liparis tanakae]|uniref:Uncharacterized protein n=1 Tax=Liparis tanakae TaxID=230148 RepID=A0A4Z2EE53_9TELE|nr:hypothetical protein EYF80_062701 [Liparis tanakae]
MKERWTMLGLLLFFLLSVVMTCCFVWQYRMPKLEPGAVGLYDLLLLGR